MDQNTPELDWLQQFVRLQGVEEAVTHTEVLQKVAESLEQPGIKECWDSDSQPPYFFSFPLEDETARKRTIPLLPPPSFTLIIGQWNYPFYRISQHHKSTSHKYLDAAAAA